VREGLVRTVEDKISKRDALNYEIGALEAEIGLIDKQLKQSGPRGASGKIRRKRNTKEQAQQLILSTLGGISGVAGLTLKEICLKSGLAWSSAYRAVKGNPLFEQKDGKWMVKNAGSSGPPPRRIHASLPNREMFK
jgi:hypothetical protein